MCFLSRKARRALENGADPNYIGPEGFAAIHLAAGLDGCSGQQLLNLMLIYGGNPNLKSSDSETALHVAVMWNREIATQILLSHGADPNIRNADGMTAFDLAENTSDHELKCLDLLRNSHLDNSSESDAPSNERSVLFVPAQSSNHALRPDFNPQLRLSREKSMEPLDVTDGHNFEIGSQMNNIQGSGSPFSYQKTSPNFVHFPYNPLWMQDESLGVPYNFQGMNEGVIPPQIPASHDVNSQRHQKDSFFDISLPHGKTRDSQSTHAFASFGQFNSDSEDSINTAFTWDSDIDSSTSYFSLPKHSLKSLITELKDGEERNIPHKGVNGEASIIIGSDFESRISLGEIPLSLIRNTNESILNEQLKKNHGRKSAEKLFLRRAKLYDMHSGKKMGRSHSSLKTSPEMPSVSPGNMRMQRPTYFRSPFPPQFPLIRIPSQSSNRTAANFIDMGQSRTDKITENVKSSAKVDKTTQKYLDSTESEEKMETMPSKTHQHDFAMGSNQKTPVSNSLLNKREGLSQQTQQTQTIPNAFTQGSSTSNQGSADINTQTPTTDETLSQPGNEETEIECSLLHAIGSPRALYSGMNETPSTLQQTLFDRTFLTPNTQPDKLADGDIFKFGDDVTGSCGKKENVIKSFSKIQRKIDVLKPNETEVFSPAVESGAGESDGSSSGYSGDLSQTSSPDDIAPSHPVPMFDLKNSPSVTLRNKRRKGLVDGHSKRVLEKQSSTDSNSVAEEAEDECETKAALPSSPRKRLNGVASSSDEADQPDRGDNAKRDRVVTKSPVPPKKNVPNSPGRRIRERVDHTFERNFATESPLLPDDLRAYHKAQLEKPINGRRQWEKTHKNGCVCELCMTKKGQTAATASLPYCEHGQCWENEECAFKDVTFEYDWKDVSLMESTSTEHSIVVPEEIKLLPVEELRQRLVKAGEKPGPITDNTRNVYMKHLARIEAGVVQTEKVRSVKSLDQRPNKY